MTLQDVIAQAQKIEATGFPIDWKQMTMKVLQEAEASAGAQHQKIEELEAWKKSAFVAHPNIDLDITASKETHESDKSSTEGDTNSKERPSGTGDVQSTEEGEAGGAPRH